MRLAFSNLRPFSGPFQTLPSVRTSGSELSGASALSAYYSESPGLSVFPRFQTDVAEPNPEFMRGFTQCDYGLIACYFDEN